MKNSNIYPRKRDTSPQKSTYWGTCPHCGAALDPGESCDCKESRKSKTGRAG